MKNNILNLKTAVKAADGSAVTLSDLQTGAQVLASQDERFNKAPAANGEVKAYLYVPEIICDGAGAFRAVINAMDGKCYEVDLVVAKGEVTELGGDAYPVMRRTTWVKASLRFNGDPVVKAKAPEPVRAAKPKMPDAPDEGDASAQTPDQQAAARRANLKSKVADAHEESYPDGEGHGSKGSAHMNAQWAHEHAASLASAGPAKDFHAGAAQYHSAKANEHGKVTARDELRAAGNGPGAASGHYTRKATAATDASQEAHAASGEAHADDTDDNHTAAATAHTSASDAHQAAMLAAAKANKPKDAKFHADMMGAHDACADAHCGDSDDAVATATARIGDLLKVSATYEEKPDVIHCRASTGVRLKASKPWKVGEETKFMYLPGGVSTVTAGFRDGAIQLTVDVDEETAKVVQASFDDLVATTKQEPFGCFEHREEEASVHPKGFGWGEHLGDQGVLVTAEPTELGASNVNGKIHRSWSPSFYTDADYAKAEDKNGVMVFPDGARGSRTNPAKVTGVAHCVGTLTNKPAFRNMAPVKATQQQPAAPKKQTADEIFAQLTTSRAAAPEVVKAKRLDDVFAALRKPGEAGDPHAKK